MPPRLPLLSLVALAAASASACVALPATSSADEPIAASAHGTAIVADAGYAAWRGDGGRIVIRAGDSTPRTTNLRPPASAIFDVGIRRGGGGAQLAYAEHCSIRSRACAVRAANLSSSGTASARVVAHIPYHGGGSPALAVDGSRLSYAVHGTTGSGRQRSACDVPYVRTLPDGGARKLDRGHCAAISQLDMGDGYVAVLAHPAVQYGSGATEARVVKVGGGPSRTLERETQGEESNFIGALSIDRQALYTARAGIRQPNAFIRFALGNHARADARAFVTLNGSFARDRGRNSYLQTVDYEASSGCAPIVDASACLVVAGSDPFAGGTRTLVPQLALTIAPQPVYTDSAPAAVATLTRRTVTRTAVVGAPAPVPGATVELLSALPTAAGLGGPPAPTGATGTTGADGSASIPVPGSPTPRRFLAAVARPAGGAVAIPTSGLLYVQTYVHVTATTARLADGRLQVSGAISPAQPGRKVRLDRKLDRICNQGVAAPPTIVMPNQVGVPAGCFDRYTQDPVTTAAVSADGTSYILTAPAGAAPAGTYSMSLDSPRGVTVYAGQSAGVDAP